MDLTKLYSEKVMEHFQHPRNVGVMENPDGVGTVGNPVCGDVLRLYIKVDKKDGEEIVKDAKFQTLGCLPLAEEIVITDGQWKPIDEVLKHSHVLNGERDITFAAETYNRNFTGKVLTIVPFVSPFNAFTVTPNHPVLCVSRKNLKKTRKSSSKCGWLRTNKEELLSVDPDYVSAGELDVGDYLIFPISSETKDNSQFTKNIMRLLGYYLAEGYITAGSVINFSLNRKEKKLIEEIRSLVLEVTGKKTSERTRGNVTEIRFCSKRWSDFFYEHCKRLARGKDLSKTLLQLPYKKQWEMIQTFMLGDGDTYYRRPKDSVTYRMLTTSKMLAIQIQEILARGQIFASIRKILKEDCVIDGRKLKDSIQYLISFKLEKEHNFVRNNGKSFLVPIRKIVKSDYHGEVYNIQVAGEPNSYLVRGFATHNCGAAIATSSIATEMIKGKPLSEAMELTNQAITEALGGLPPVKRHCSVLAAEAVKKAIADYESKKK